MGYGYGSPGGMMGGGYGVGSIIGFFMMIVFFILIIVGVVLLIKWLVEQTSRGAHPHSMMGDQALDILRQRYAKGEISKEEFDQMRKDLG